MKDDDNAYIFIANRIFSIRFISSDVFERMKQNNISKTTGTLCVYKNNTFLIRYAAAKLNNLYL